MERRASGTWYEALVELLLLLCGVVSALVVAIIFLFLLYFTIPLAVQGDLTKLFSWEWRPFAGRYGILPMVAGSFCLAVSATLTAYPIGVGICCFINGVGPRFLARPLLIVVEFMTGVPTVVYGFVSAFLLVPLIRWCFEYGVGFCWLAASVTLTLLILPTIVLVIHSQLRQLGPAMQLTAAALGMSSVQALAWIVLPQASRGLMAGAVLGFGRALGDTIVSLMLAGNAPQLPHSLLDSIRTLTAHIALVVATDVHSDAYQSLFVAGLILVIMSALLNISIRWVVGTKDMR